MLALPSLEDDYRLRGEIYGGIERGYVLQVLFSRTVALRLDCLPVRIHYLILRTIVPISLRFLLLHRFLIGGK